MAANLFAQRDHARSDSAVQLIFDARLWYEFDAASGMALEHLRKTRSSKDLSLIIEAFDQNISSTRVQIQGPDLLSRSCVASLWLYNAGSTAADFLVKCRQIGFEVPQGAVSHYCDVAFEGFDASYIAEACRGGRYDESGNQLHLVKSVFGFAERHGRKAEMLQIGPMLLGVDSAALRRSPSYFEVKSTLQEMLRTKQKLLRLDAPAESAERVAVPVPAPA